MASLPSSLLPSAARAAVVLSSAAPSPLLPLETAAVARAVPKRREEFARGRTAAREALRALGLSPAPIPVGAHREPIWPAGVVGSISHCDALACAAVAPSSRVPVLGIDVEPARPLPPEVRERVLVADEIAALDAAGMDPLVGFSAKECIHKAVFPATGVWLDFDHVGLVPVDGTDRIRGEARDPAMPGSARRILERLQMRWASKGGLVYAAAWIETDV